MTLLRDLITIPERVHQGDFVLQLSKGVTEPEQTLRDYVVTPQLVDAFANALGFIQQAVQTGGSKAAYLHGSFGSGKSHFMAVLNLLLAGNTQARATPELAEMLGLRAGVKVFHTVLVHLENGVPIQWEDRYVNPAAAPDYLKADWATTTPTHYLLTHAPLTQASYSIEACVPTPEQAHALEITSTEACLAMVRRTVSGANVASLARLIYPGSRYRFAGEFQS